MFHIVFDDPNWFILFQVCIVQTWSWMSKKLKSEPKIYPVTKFKEENPVITCSIQSPQWKPKVYSENSKVYI